MKIRGYNIKFRSLKAFLMLKSLLIAKYSLFKNKDNPLESFFYNPSSNSKHMTKWNNYFEIYHTYFKKYSSQKISLIEFGTFHGGSLDMWSDYFSKDSRIIGVDINPYCKELENEGYEIFIGDQENKEFLRELMGTIGNVDIVVEDGGHEMKQQIHTFQEVFPYLNNGGIFCIEDLETSYFQSFGGGFRKEGTFIEFSKNLIDSINVWHLQNDIKTLNEYSSSIKSMHVYDSVILFEKDELEDSPYNIEVNNSDSDNYYFNITKEFLKINDKLKKEKIRILTFGINIDILKKWISYFNEKIEIIGIDNDSKYKKLEKKNFKIIIEDLNTETINRIAKSVGKVDIIIEKGIYKSQRMKIFEKFFDSLNDNGLFIIEELFTNNEYQNKNDILEFSKDLIDSINAWYSEDGSFEKSDNIPFKPDKYTHSLKSMHFYDNLIIFEKDSVKRKYSISRGKKSDYISKFWNE